jgi:Hint domain-containing protein
MCSPGSGPDPGDVRLVKTLGDGTHIVQDNGRCVRARFRACHTKCLPPDARIATPAGDVPIRDIRVGADIWTQDANGRRIAARVERFTSVEVVGEHHVARIELADGRALTVSPEHPVVDARVVQQLRVGEPYDGSSVVKLELVRYTGARTYDLLPSGPTGVYWADDIPLRSTIDRGR